MVGEWPIVDLPTLADFQEGPGILAVDFKETGIPLLRLKSIEGTFATLVGCNYLDPEKVKQRWDHFRLIAGDLLISTSASLGRVSEVTADTAGSIAYTGIIRFRPKSSITKDFLRVLLGSHEFKRQAEAMASGSVIRHFGPSHLREMRFQLPPPNVQEAIGEVAAALDDRIELNRRMAETLESTARAMFENWIEKDEGRSLVAAQALIYSGVLQIGDGYRAKNEELGMPGLPFLRAADLNGGINTATADFLSASSVEAAGAKTSRPGDVAFTSKGTVGRFARVDERTPAFVYSPQVCFWRSLNHEILPPALLYLMMTSTVFRSQLDVASGQTDMAPYVSLRDQRRIVLPSLPPNAANFSARIEILLSRQSALRDESHTIVSLRDTIVPKLIAGELRIRDAEKAVAVA